MQAITAAIMKKNPGLPFLSLGTGMRTQPETLQRQRFVAYRIGECCLEVSFLNVNLMPLPVQISNKMKRKNLSIERLAVSH